MSAAADELVLIDANSLAYRAYFALPEELSTKDGFPTNAILGFASMLVKLITDHGLRPTIVVWDAGHSGRKEMYPEYKAQRSTRPDLFKEQWPHLEPIAEAFGYRNVRLDGFEADDVIATLAERARKAGLPTIIVTGDRDAYQLAGDGVRIMTTSRGITDTKTYDAEGVVDRYGIPPELVPDFIGLKGDTSDNIPGVPGIGDKTAADLLNEYGTLEDVLEAAPGIKAKKRRENLIEFADDARMGKALAVLKRDLPVELDPLAEVAREPDRSTLRETFRKFELRAPLERLEEALGDPDTAAPAMAAETTLEAKLSKGGPGAAAKLEPASAPVAIALRAPVVAEGELFAAEEEWRFAATAGGGTVVAGPLARPEDLVAALDGRAVVAHDAKSLGVVPGELVHDTEVAAYLLEPQRRGYPLRELADDRGLAASTGDDVADDALLVRAIADAQRGELRERGLLPLLEDIELPLVAAIREMEQEGVRIDLDRLAAINERVGEEITSLEREIWTQAGTEFTIGSPQQLGEVLFETLGLTRKRRGKTGYSTDARVLQAIRDEHEIIPMIERFREITKLRSTYLEALPHLVDGESRLHTTFHQTATATGRLSSTDPNLQNIPIRTPLGREIRGCFVAAPGMSLISCDYSQVELRVLAHVADEDVLKQIFRRGEDVHTATASEVLKVPRDQLDEGMRSKAKMVNYGIVYGLTSYGLADRLQIPQEEAQGFIDRYLDGFPAVKAFIEATITSAEEEGYVTTLLGRRRRIPELRARNRQTRELGQRLAVNTIIQGTAADIIKIAMVRASEALRDSPTSTRPILQIHDELLFEGPTDEAEAARDLVVRAMVDAYELDPPLEVDSGIGPSWMEAK